MTNTPTTDPVQTDYEGEEMRDKIEAIIRKHVYCDATGLSPHIASVFLHGFDKAAEEITALRSTPEGGDQGAWRPIETATKDTRSVLLVATYPFGSTVWSDVRAGWWDGSAWTRWPHYFPPTHWAPIPKLPTPQPQSHTEEAEDA